MEDPLLPLANSVENAGTVICSRSPINQGTCALCSSCLTASLVAYRQCGWWLGCLGASTSGRLFSNLACLLLILLTFADL